MATGARIAMVQGGQTPNPGAVISQPAGGVSPMARLDLNEVHPEIGASINDVRAEVDDAYAQMKTFYQLEPDHVMRLCSGHSARLSELRMRIHRVEDYARQWKPIRVREIEPTLEELANQYAIASRLHSVRELDWKIEQGER